MEENFRRVLISQDTAEEDIEDMENAQQLSGSESSLTHFFLSIQKSFSIYNDGISRDNLVVDFKGKRQALIDWECVSVMPLWKAYQIPSFIDILKRTERLNSEDYKRNANESINSLSTWAS